MASFRESKTARNLLLSYSAEAQARTRYNFFATQAREDGYVQIAKLFDEIRIPVRTINGDLWPIDYEANRRHMFSFDATIIKGADHFLMMDRPEKFNHALEKSINSLLSKPTK